MGVCRLKQEDYVEYHMFISYVMCGSGYEIKDYHKDFLPFMEDCKPDWITTYKKSKETGIYPVYEGTKIVWDDDNYNCWGKRQM